MRKVYVLTKADLYTKNFLNQLYEVIPENKVTYFEDPEELLNNNILEDDDLVVVDNNLDKFLDISIKSLIDNLLSINQKIKIIVLSLLPKSELAEYYSAYDNVFFLQKLNDNRNFLKDLFGTSDNFINVEGQLQTQQVKSKRKKILVIDDFKNTRYIVKLSLEKEGFIVETAADGVEALNVLEKEPDIALLIVDLNMPRMDGLKFISHVRSNDLFKDKPIIILTTDVSKRNKQKAKELKVTGWIQKPYKLSEFVDIVKRTLAQ